MRRRRIAVVTGTRAEFGLLAPIMERLAADRRVSLRLLVTGQHLMPRFGSTVREIEASGLPIAARVPMALRSDSALDVARATAAGLDGLARALAREKADLLVVLGDRYEVLAAACAALPLRIPVAHIHGGESTEGAIDEQIRHAVTKLSHLHFPAAEPYRRRLLAMGEDPRRVFCFGAPGVDGLRAAPAIGKEALWRDLGVPPGARAGVVTFHPVTLEGPEAARRQAREVLAALARTKGVFWVLTLPNADPGSLAVVRAWRAFPRAHPGRAVVHASLGRERYRSLLRHADVMVGNSSSGLIEAPSFGLPVVNVGDRQKGRLRAANVIDVPRGGAGPVAAAVRRALSPSFRRRARAARNPYEGPRTCARIASTLASVPLGRGLLVKSLSRAAA